MPTERDLQNATDDVLEVLWFTALNPQKEFNGTKQNVVTKALREL